MTRLLIAATIVLGAVACCVGAARAHDPYSAWKARNGMSCCNGSDCGPTRAYVDEQGNWQAWDGEGWVVIPSSALLPADLAGDGRSHYCGKRAPNGIPLPYCFSPGEIRG